LWLETSELPELEICVALKNQLLKARLIKINEICALTREDFLSIKGIGKNHLVELESALAKIGRHLKP
jgi:DNA-directed RNA polymerase alpha subunit